MCAVLMSLGTALVGVSAAAALKSKLCETRPEQGSAAGAWATHSLRRMARMWWSAHPR